MLVVVGAGCTSEGRADPAAVPVVEEKQLMPELPDELDVQPSLQLPCAGMPTEAPPDDFEIISGTVALPTSPAHPDLQTSRREAADGSTYFFAKTGLVWNTTSSFELVVPAKLRSHLAIGWGGPAPHGHSVEISCSDEDEWVGLPGGFWVTEPLCADLLVRTQMEEIVVQIGLGIACDGQAPPQGQSDR